MYLGFEDEHVQANIGGMGILEGPPPKLSELHRKAGSMMGQLPRFRQRLLELPQNLGRPLWVDDEDFDLERHLYAVNLGREVSEQKLQDHFAYMMSRKLDRDHPLWQTQVVTGLPDGRWALLWSVHHALVDGVAATELMAMLLGFDPGETVPECVESWTPRSKPSTVRALSSAFTGRAGPLKPLRDLTRVVKHPGKALSLTARSAQAILPVTRSILTSNENPLNGEIGPERIWRTAELDLAKVKVAGTLNHGTVNDVVLAAVTNGLRDFFIGHGIDASKFKTRTMVPVSIRSEDERGNIDNRVSAVFVDMPIGIADPLERMQDVSRQMDAVKASRGEVVAELFGELLNYIPNTLFEAFDGPVLRATDLKRLFNTVTTNVPGPQAPLYCLGREMISLHPYVMLMRDQRINSAIFSYNGKVYFGITGDRDHVKDLSAICDGIEAALDDLIRVPEDDRPRLRLVA
jgi:WS/DGAT/MGAT family acyltransferase